jgi:hypothetical protein
LPVKLFISYGHDANQDFVRTVKADLERHGHACWIDSERIHDQADWRRSLTDALHHCEWTVGFLSRWAMRPGVARCARVVRSSRLRRLRSGRFGVFF